MGWGLGKRAGYGLTSSGVHRYLLRLDMEGRQRRQISSFEIIETIAHLGRVVQDMAEVAP